MNRNTLSQHYDQFTPRERLRLALAAQARGDEEEVVRLRHSCPHRTLAIEDPNYTNLLDCMYGAVVAVVMCWVEVSHRLLQSRVRLDDFNLLVLRCDAQIVDRLRGSGDSEDLEVICREYVVRKAEADATCRKWSAFWSGIETAVIRFCDEIGLTRNQLFALLLPAEPHVIEEARHALDPEVAADHEREEEVYSRLYQGWRAEWNLQDDPFCDPTRRVPQANKP